MAAAPELLPEAEVGVEAVPQIGGIALLAVYTMLVGAIAAGATAHYVIGPIERFIRGLIRKVEAELHYLEHHLRGATVVIRKTITHVIMPQVKAATVAVPRYIHRDLLAVRAEARHAERIAHRALRQAHKAEARFGSKPFAAAVAAALGALGLEW